MPNQDGTLCGDCNDGSVAWGKVVAITLQGGVATLDVLMQRPSAYVSPGYILHVGTRHHGDDNEHGRHP